MDADLARIGVELVGALIFAIPLTARAYVKRQNAAADADTASAAADKKVADAVEKAMETFAAQNKATEARLVTAELALKQVSQQHQQCEDRVGHLQRQSDADQIVIAGLAGRNEESDQIIRGMRKELDELRRTVTTGVHRSGGGHHG